MKNKLYRFDCSVLGFCYPNYEKLEEDFKNQKKKSSAQFLMQDKTHPQDILLTRNGQCSRPLGIISEYYTTK